MGNDNIKIELNKYKEALLILDKLFILNGFKDNNYSKLDELVNTYINLYNSYGIDLKNELFNYEIFPKIDNNNIVVSDNIKKYINKEELDIDKKEIFKEIKYLFSKINNRYRDIFNSDIDDVNKLLNGYGIQKVSINNIKEVRNCLVKRIKCVEIETREEKKEEDTKKKDDILSVDLIDDEFNIIDDVCNKLTKNEFKKMSEFEKKQMYNDLPEILDIIAKYKFFVRMSGLYNKYKEKNINKYNKILEVINERDLLDNELSSYVGKEKEISEKNTSIIYPSISKIKDMENIEKKIVPLGKKLLDKNEDILNKKIEYMNGFYKTIDTDDNGLLHKLGSLYNITLVQDNPKLFGVFSLESLPVNSDTINNMGIFRRNSIVIPDSKDDEFIRIVNMCLNLLSTVEIDKSKKR